MSKESRKPVLSARHDGDNITFMSLYQNNLMFKIIQRGKTLVFVILKKGASCVMIIEVESVTRFQILNKAICISDCVNTLNTNLAF